MKFNKLIEDIILESSLDSRIRDGLIDLGNIEHIQVVAEAMYDACEDENIVNEFVQSFVDEGKYPDRQAYNKDGWLVTFPSAEYKQRAIKKGTHFTTDPTHGKGGMNLYYKKRGKQKRQTQQVVTKTEPVGQSQKPVSQTEKPAPQVEKPEQVPTAVDTTNDTASRASRLAKLTGAGEKKTAPAQDSNAATSTDSTETPKTKPEVPDKPTQSTEKPQTTPAPTAPTPPSYTTLSANFATSKGWKATPYGEWRDESGTTVAVVGLYGEVVPIKNTDREELKIAIEKASAV